MWRPPEGGTWVAPPDPAAGDAARSTERRVVVVARVGGGEARSTSATRALRRASPPRRLRRGRRLLAGAERVGGVVTLDPMYGEFVLTQEKVQIPKSGKIYSFNEGNYALWDDKLKKYMDSLKEPGTSGKPYSARYIGSLVGDFHRTMLYGGIYGYPRDTNSKNGKLRLLYECAPMSFIAEQAGGKGSDGHQRVLDIMPTEVHQRVPLYVGSVEEVEKVEKFLA